MSGKKEVQKGAPKKGGDKGKGAAAGEKKKKKQKQDVFKEIKNYQARKERERILFKMVHPKEYAKKKRIRMAQHYRRLQNQQAKKSYLRALNNPYLYKDPRDIIKQRRQYFHKRGLSGRPAAYTIRGKISPKNRLLIREAMPLLRLARERKLRKAKVFNPAPHVKLNTTAKWIAAERRYAEWMAKARKEERKKAKAAKKAAAKKPEEKKEEEKKVEKVDIKEGVEVSKTPSVKKGKTTSKGRGRRPGMKKNLKPGCILITLIPPNLGRRVIFLKQLPSGTLLCAGPKRLNGAALHRIHPNHVIATTTKIDISSIKLGKLKETALFRQKRNKKSHSNSKIFFGEEKKAEKVTNVKPLVAATKAIDKQLLPLIKKEPFLSKYLSARFTLGRFTYPHLIKF